MRVDDIDALERNYLYLKFLDDFCVWLLNVNVFRRGCVQDFQFLEHFFLNPLASVAFSGRRQCCGVLVLSPGCESFHLLEGKFTPVVATNL
jgi:hypothetical protein